MVLKMKVILLALAILMSFVGCTGESNTKATAEIPQFAFEGDIVPVKVTIDGEAKGIVTLEEYEFHYIMHPDIAPEPDTWPHKPQMEYMQAVIDGKVASFVPSIKDGNIKEILEISPKKSYTLKESPDGTYILNWNATHGRIFFRIKAGDEYVGDLYTTRVHCNHVDMRSFERLKDSLEAMALPLEHKNTAMAETVFEGAYSLYKMGHSPRFMLMHHEYPADDLDALFDSLKEKIENGDLEGAENKRAELFGMLIEKEGLFYELAADTEGNILRVTIQDKINDYSFHDDLNTRVYLRAIDQEEEALDMMAGLHGGPTEHDHTKMSQSLDLGKLLDGARALDKDNQAFQIELDKDTKNQSLEIIVIYGAGQRYYLTKGL